MERYVTESHVLELVQAAIIREFRRRDDQYDEIWGEPRAIYASATARWNDLLLVDTSTAAVTVTLPSAEPSHIGDWLNVLKTSTDANAITIVASGDDTIDGSATASIAGGARGRRSLVCTGSAAWTIVNAS